MRKPPPDLQPDDRYWQIVPYNGRADVLAVLVVRDDGTSKIDIIASPVAVDNAAIVDFLETQESMIAKLQESLDTILDNYTKMAAKVSALTQCEVSYEGEVTNYGGSTVYMSGTSPLSLVVHGNTDAFHRGDKVVVINATRLDGVEV